MQIFEVCILEIWSWMVKSYVVIDVKLRRDNFFILRVCFKHGVVSDCIVANAYNADTNDTSFECQTSTKSRDYMICSWSTHANVSLLEAKILSVKYVLLIDSNETMCKKRECCTHHKDLSVSGSRERGGKVHWPSSKVTLYRDLSELNMDHICLNFNENPSTGSTDRANKCLCTNVKCP